MKPYVRRTLPPERKIFSEPMTLVALAFSLIDGTLELSLTAGPAEHSGSSGA